MIMRTRPVAPVGGTCGSNPCTGNPCCGPSPGPCCGSNDPCCGVDCDDGDPCTRDSCVNGECINALIDCDDGRCCTVDSCVNGLCVNELIECLACRYCDETACALGAPCVKDCSECPDPPNEPDPPHWVLVPDTRCNPVGGGDICPPNSLEQPQGPCNAEMRCYRLDTVTLEAEGQRDSIGGTLSCDGCTGCPDNPVPPPTCESTLQQCSTASVQFEISASVTIGVPFLQGELTEVLGFSDGQQTCLGGGCGVTLQPCQWATLEHTMTQYVGRRARAHHQWAWFRLLSSPAGSICGCAIQDKACPQSAESTATGTGVVGGVTCQVTEGGSCPPP